MTINFVKELTTIIKDESRISTNDAILLEHGKGLMYHETKLPDVVVYPNHKDEVKMLVHFANKNNIPLVPFGIGSSLEGQIIPQRGGISVDFSKMNEIVHVSPEDFIVVVQPGVTREQLNNHLKKFGLFFPVDPGVNATIGGMVANNASGTNSIKYGVMKDQVLALEIVLADGRVIQTGSKAMKSASSFGLKELFIGSEGTLGLFTEITLRLHGIPENFVVSRCCFNSIEEAGDAATQILSSGLQLGKLELVDALTIEAVNKYLNMDLPIADSLFIECSGSEKEVDEQIKLIEQIVTETGGFSFEFENNSINKSNLWKARHDAGMAIAAAYPGHQLMSTDVAVPLSKLTDAIRNARELVEQSNSTAAIFGHVGDGNFHVVIAIDKENNTSLEHALQLNELIVQHALEVEGTCTGEHGIGTGKISYLKQEHGEAYEVMKEIKNMFDPNNILNPNILFNHKGEM